MVRYFLLLCMGILLVGCDQFPGPSVRNEFSRTVNLTVTYSDAESFSHEWPPCRTFGLGAMDVGRFGVKAREGVSIESIVIEIEGEVIHRFDKATIDSLINKEKEKEERGHTIWVVDESGIHLSVDRECPLIQRVPDAMGSSLDNKG